MKLKQLYYCDCHAEPPPPAPSSSSLWTPKPSDLISSSRIESTQHPFNANGSSSSKRSVFSEIDVQVYINRKVESYCALFDLRVEVTIVNQPALFADMFAKKFGFKWTPITDALAPPEQEIDAAVGDELDFPKDGHGVILLASLQQVMVHYNASAGLVREVIDLCEEAGEELQGMGDESLARAMFMYAHALAVRLANRNPLANWACFKRSCVLYDDHLASWVTHVREEQDHVWRLLCAVAIGRTVSREENNLPVEEEDVDDDFDLIEMLLSSVLGFASVIKEETHAARKPQQQQPQQPRLTAPDELTCAQCFNPLRQPVTFGDGSTVCRRCVAVKRRNLTLFSSAIDTKGDEFDAPPDEEQEEKGDLVPVHEVFGNQFDIILGQICTMQDRAAATAVGDALPELLRWKEHANELYVRQEYAEAEQAYSRCIEANSAPASLLAVLFSNRSACRHKLGDAAGAQQDARLAIKFSNGRWAKAHARLFEAHTAPPPPRGDDEEEGGIPEEEYVKSMTSTLRTTAARTAAAADDGAVVHSLEAMCALVRAMAMGMPLSNTYRRVMCRFVLSQADWLAADPSRNARRHTSLLMQLVRELTHGTELAAVLMLQPSPSSSSLEPKPRAMVKVPSDDVLDCVLCMALLCEPCTLPCGHTFCKTCAVRAIDHAQQPCCPMCRMDLDPLMATLNDQAWHKELAFDQNFSSGLNELQTNQCLAQFLRAHCGQDYQDRLDQTAAAERSVGVAANAEEGEDGAVHLPMLCTPKVCFGRTMMIIAEPANRLLMRRLGREVREAAAAENDKDDEEEEESPEVMKKKKEKSLVGCFGICWEVDGVPMSHGVVAELEMYETLASQEYETGCPLSVSSVGGGTRFTVVRTYTRDGYLVGVIKLQPTRSTPHTLPSEELDEWRKQIADEYESSRRSASSSSSSSPHKAVNRALKQARAGLWASSGDGNVNPPDDDGGDWRLLCQELLEYWKELREENGGHDDDDDDKEEEADDEYATLMDKEGEPANAETLLFRVAHAMRVPEPLKYYMLYSPRLGGRFEEEARFLLRLLACRDVVDDALAGPADQQHQQKRQRRRLDKWEMADTIMLQAAGGPWDVLLSKWYPGLGDCFAGVVE